MITPVGHRILVKQDKLEETDDVFRSAKRAGLVFSDMDEAKRHQAAIDTGVVTAIGPSAWKDFGTEPWCKVGDRVAFAKYAGKAIKDGEEMFIILNDEDVVAKIGDNNG